MPRFFRFRLQLGVDYSMLVIRVQYMLVLFERCFDFLYCTFENVFYFYIFCFFVSYFCLVLSDFTRAKSHGFSHSHLKPIKSRINSNFTFILQFCEIYFFISFILRCNNRNLFISAKHQACMSDILAVGKPSSTSTPKFQGNKIQPKKMSSSSHVEG